MGSNSLKSSYIGEGLQGLNLKLYGISSGELPQTRYDWISESSSGTKRKRSYMIDTLKVLSKYTCQGLV